jgi:hypothetical protein
VAVAKLVCFDSTASEVAFQEIEVAPELCFIDGEHTAAAVMSGFAFCRRVCAPDAIIYFHDDWVICSALRQILRELRRKEIRHRAVKLPGCTFAILLGESSRLAFDSLRGMSANGSRHLRRLHFRQTLKTHLPSFALRLIRSASGVLRSAAP